MALGNREDSCDYHIRMLSLGPNALKRREEEEEDGGGGEDGGMNGGGEGKRWR